MVLSRWFELRDVNQLVMFDVVHSQDSDGVSTCLSDEDVVPENAYTNWIRQALCVHGPCQVLVVVSTPNERWLFRLPRQWVFRIAQIQLHQAVVEPICHKDVGKRGAKDALKCRGHHSNPHWSIEACVVVASLSKHAEVREVVHLNSSRGVEKHDPMLACVSHEEIAFSRMEMEIGDLHILAEVGPVVRLVHSKIARKEQLRVAQSRSCHVHLSQGAQYQLL
mmetsp:Transcript_90114/g.160492  ORF Transcript_90114/g.160492 Transcript_90114/m.160492 type:complete len:222 (+) Transcript_90114:609-1274(+)